MDGKLSLGTGKPSPPGLLDAGEYVVDFDGDGDPLHPYNWARSKKCVTFFFLHRRLSKT